MSNMFPLFPELPEAAQEEANKLIESFKAQITKAAEESIQTLYTEILPYIESDSWSNFRRELMDGFQNYNNRKIQNEYDFAKIRKKIFEEFKDEIVKDLDKDIYKENQELKNQIEHLSSIIYELRRIQ